MMLWSGRMFVLEFSAERASGHRSHTLGLGDECIDRAILNFMDAMRNAFDTPGRSEDVSIQ